MQRPTLVILFLFLLFTACEKVNIKAGEQSLEGNWAVMNITTLYGERSDLGITVQENFEENGSLGAFNFSERKVIAEYTRLDTLYDIASIWELKRDKINEGFFKVEQYTLCLEDQNFICKFGDQTKNAERDATRVRLLFETTEMGAYEQFILELEKE